MLFLLGVALEPALLPLSMVGAVTYQNETITTINYTTIGSSDIATINSRPVYDTYSNHTLGFYLMIAAGLGLTLILVDRRRDGA